MTSILAARDELDAALVAGSIPVADAPGQAAPPCAIIFGEGLADLEHVVRGQVTARFRITLVAGGWDLAEVGRVLTGLVQQTVTIIRATAGWRLDSVGRDGRVIGIAGGDMLGTEVIASRMIDIS